MAQDLRTFYLRLSLFTIVVALVYYGIRQLGFTLLDHPAFPFVLVFFALTTAGFHLGLVKAEARGNQQFVRFYMGATTAKLLLYMVVIVIYAFLVDENTRIFLIDFFLLYLLYTSFEVSFVYRKLTAMKQAGKSDNRQ
jgi:L-asparagine transporter-like permease